MKYDLTKEQVEKLNKAIDLAEEPGGCRYAIDGKPCCVIGQLAVLEGVPVSELDSAYGIELFLKRGCLSPISALAAYPLDLLICMQVRWDNSFSFSSIDDARDWVRQLIT